MAKRKNVAAEKIDLKSGRYWLIDVGDIGADAWMEPLLQMGSPHLFKIDHHSIDLPVLMIVDPELLKRAIHWAYANRKTDDEAAIVALFDRARVDIYGPASARPAPYVTDHLFARRWLHAGANAEMLDGIFRKCFRAKHAKGMLPLNSLSAVHQSVHDALAALNAEMGLRHGA